MLRTSRSRRILSFTTFALAAALPAQTSTTKEFVVTSPDARIACELRTTARGSGAGIVRYAITRDGHTIVEPSGFVVTLDDVVLQDGFEVVGSDTDQVDHTWQNPLGERRVVPERYRETTLALRGANGQQLRFRCRVYDEGVAFSYDVLDEARTTVAVTDEHFEFGFVDDHACWPVDRAQGAYRRVPIGELGGGAFQPLVVECGDDTTVALAEAALVDFARLRFERCPHRPAAVRTRLDGRTVKALPFRSPWRVVMLADDPGQLLERNHLILNLNAPCAIDDPSWIRPGKVIREVTLTTAGGRACVDFAAAHGIRYVEFDAGWYGHEYDDASDATTVTVDPKRSKGPLDLPGVIAYAKQKDVGVLLYVNRRALETQLDELLPLFRSWGVAGIKFGFVQVGSQPATAWLHESVAKAAAHGFVVDVHDEYRPTGVSRTWPNLLTQEGIRGDEESIPNSHTLVTMFTRMLAGAADNTVCYYDGRVDARMGSHASQLAKTVCLFSPLQFLYWYDRPAASPGSGGTRIGDEPELAFFDRVPTVWDETRVLEARIGEFGLIARRSGREWFVGGISGDTAVESELALTFVEEGQRYVADVYTDDPELDTRTKVRVAHREVDRTTVLPVRLAPNNGIALRIAPVDDR